jgi:UDP-N-acetylglucosamine 1-carboxyvinyltransferase
MDKFLIRGKKRLFGEVNISGMKNSALPIIFGTICSGGVCVIENLPDVSDISLALEVLRAVGAKTRFVNTDTVVIDTTEITTKRPPLELVGKMRGSTYLIGAMLGRFGQAQVGNPGGCDFGTRPLDLHFKGFERLGAKITYEGNANIMATAPAEGLCGNLVYLDIASVGATINIMLAAVFAKGVTIIENAAREPHIVDTACFLNACGANITGAGTSMIRITGVKELHGCTYSIAPDMIEAGTYMVAAAAAGGRLEVKKIIPKHLDAITIKLREMGVSVETGDNCLTVVSDGKFRGTSIKTNPYPGFPTDMHPQFSAMLCLAEGMSSVSEGIWSGRFRYTEELKKMGAVIDVVDNVAHISGVSGLSGAEVKASDLRAGACLVIAGLCADGQTTISGIEYIDRGYQDFVDKLRAIGADITRI